MCQLLLLLRSPPQPRGSEAVCYVLVVTTVDDERLTVKDWVCLMTFTAKKDMWVYMIIACHKIKQSLCACDVHQILEPSQSIGAKQVHQNASVAVILQPTCNKLRRPWTAPQ
jgi:hypothetical protein